MDAGPHVKVLVRPADAARVRSVLECVAGVLRVIEARPGEGARVDDGAVQGPLAGENHLGLGAP
jgi:hypothetical protein